MQSVPSSFWEWAASLRSDDLIGLVAVVAPFTVGAIAIICGAIYKIHRTRAETALKRELLDRGMSAEEIAIVVSARPSKGSRPPLP